jgi:hypothetical protein
MKPGANSTGLSGRPHGRHLFLCQNQESGKAWPSAFFSLKSRIPQGDALPCASVSYKPRTRQLDEVFFSVLLFKITEMTTIGFCFFCGLVRKLGPLYVLLLWKIHIDWT